ncbi:MAG: cation-transporting P-type ATPase [Polyangiaceae bacterium]
MDGSGWTTHAGLTTPEARALLSQHGPNEIPEKAPPHIARRIVAQLANPLVYVLLAALALQVALWIAEGARGVPLESIAIAALLALNAGLGAAQEAKADHALAGLRRLSTGRVSVLRDGALRDVPSREIVPGDLFRIGHGDRVPADGRLQVSTGIAVDESLTTGESIPVEKSVGDEVTSGTLTVRGSGLVLALRTGAASTTGALAASMSAIVADRTPLEKRLRVLGDRLAWSMAALVVVLVAAGVAAGGLSAFGRMLLFGAALAVAAVPEGLPAAATLTLALGVKRMAARHAIVRKLSAVETLGAVTVIATDKTGTLTENRIRVARIEGPDERALLEAMAMANDAHDAPVAGSLDGALLEEATRRGVDVAAARRAPRLSSRPFDSAWKFMRVTANLGEGGARSWSKGAPEVILARCRLDEAERARLEEEVRSFASDGFRVVAFASGEGEAEEGLAFLGFALLDDPPRAEVAASIRSARGAGIRVVMLTGDHPETARAIARQVGIDAERVVTGAELDAMDPESLDAIAGKAGVFARVRPAHKLLLVEALKRRGDVVAMTGDGVNDAPALKRSDVGIAMGSAGATSRATSPTSSSRTTTSRRSSRPSRRAETRITTSRRSSASRSRATRASWS